MSMTAEEFDVPWLCPDGGACHHECALDSCFRVQSCSPLSGVFPGNRWPREVSDKYGPGDTGTEGERM